MREIKFRGLNDYGWHVGHLLISHKDRAYIVTDMIDGDYANVKRSQEVELSTVGQYTGRKDKNGVDVYEGDIISAYFDAINGKYLISYTVKYDEFHSLYPFADFDCYESPMHFTVVGNRYESPELSKVTR